MEVILKQDIKGLGYKNDLVNVKPGYGRNFLIPKGMAMLANESNKKLIEENIRQMAHKAEKMKADAEAMAEKIGDTVLEIGAKAGETGKIFGSITTLQVADALKNKGIEIDRKRVSIPKDVKELGEYEAILDLHKEVKKAVKINVVSE